MAKLGEGDPRWIVKDLGKEGQNVGRWHWQEINATEWCKNELNKLTDKVVLYDGPEGNVSILKATLKGDASIHNRKSKLISFYEFDSTIEYIAKMTQPSEEEVKGKIQITNISEENTPDEFDYKFSTENAKERNVRTLLEKKCKPKLIEIYGGLIAALKSGALAREKFGEMEKQRAASAAAASAGNTSPATPNFDFMNIAAQQQQQKSAASSALQQAAQKAAAVSEQKPVMPAAVEDKHLKFESLEVRERFIASEAEVFSCFVDEKRLSAFTKGPCKSNPTKGGKFSLMNDYVIGEYTEVNGPKALNMKWRMKDFPADHFSQVNITISKNDSDEIVVVVKHSELPMNTKGKITSWWNEKVFMAIKLCFGYGKLF